MRTYEYRHIVSFEETNLVGNVYFANHLIWQGRTREMFIRDYMPELLQQFNRGLRIVTTKVNCEYYLELFAFDEVIIRMSASAIAQGRVTMLFRYYRNHEGAEELAAQGEQQIAFMREEGDIIIPIPVPEKLRKILQDYIQA